MILMLLWLGCARPVPAVLPTPPPPPSPVSTVDGWALLQRHAQWMYVDLLGPDAQAIAREAVAQGQGPQLALTGPPAQASHETTRRFLAAFDAQQRPIGFRWPAGSSIGPMQPLSLRVVSAVPTLDIDDGLVLRVWLEPLDDAAAPVQAVTHWRTTTPTLLGSHQRASAPPTCVDLKTRATAVPLPSGTIGSSTLCTAIALPDGAAWVATEQMYGDGDLWRGSCMASELRRPNGGIVSFGRHCRVAAIPSHDHALLYGISAQDSGPNLPVAWFSDGPQRWWVLNHTLDGATNRCLSAEPDPGTNFDRSTCPQHR